MVVGIKKSWGFTVAWIAFVLVFFYSPIVSLMVFSFNNSRSLTSWSGFSLQWYQALFENREMMAAITTTLSIALLSTFVSTVVGTLTAIGISKSRRLIKELIFSSEALINCLVNVSNEIFLLVNLNILVLFL